VSRWVHSFPEPDSGNEPDPYRDDMLYRCPHCLAEVGEPCAPWCRDIDDVPERDDE